MYQKVITDEDYPVTASEIDIETVTAPLESKTVFGTSGSEKEFTKSKRDVLEKSLSICHPQLSESTFMSNPKCSLRVSRRQVCFIYPMRLSTRNWNPIFLQDASQTKTS